MCIDIVACCFPPLAVCFKRGCGGSFFLSILLTLLGYFPGCIYACHIIHRDRKEGNMTQVTNVHVAQAQPANVTVNVAVPQQQQYPIPMNGGQNPNAYPGPGPQYPQSPITVQPPPMYNNASTAPPYYGYGQGDNNMQK